MKRVFCKTKLPCAQCPYMLGLIRTVVNPCPQCKLNRHRTFEQYQKMYSNTISQTKDRSAI